MSEPRRRWLRAAAGAAALLAAAMVLAVLWDDAGDEGGRPAQEAPATEAPPDPKAIADSLLGRRIRSRTRGGGSLRLPRGWRNVSGARSLRVTHRERSAALAVSAYSGRLTRRRVLRDALAAMEATHRSVEAAKEGRATVAGRRALTRVVNAVNRRGVKTRVLLAAASARRRTYLVQVLTAAGAPGRRLLEAQAALGSLRLPR